MSQSTIRIALPETVSSIYVVPVSKEPADIAQAMVDAITAHIEPPVRDLTIQLLTGPLMRVDIGPVQDFPPLPVDILEAMGASPEELSLVSGAEKFIAIHTVNTAAWPPYHEFAGRAAAAALAADLKSVLVDVGLPMLFSPERALSTLPDKTGAIRYADWQIAIQSIQENGQWCTTKGLFRVGLPELQAMAVPPQVRDEWSVAMTGLGWKIVKHFREGVLPETELTHFDLPVCLEVGENDLAEAYGTEPASKGSTRFYLQYERGAEDGSESYLNVVQPPGDTRSIGEYFASLCQDLFGGPGCLVQERLPSASMSQAMEAARASLDTARKRFVNNELPRGGQLIVKFGVGNAECTEYLWAFVTDWQKEDELQANCANNANLDSSLRIGCAIMIPSGAVVDWAVVLNDQIVEGGFTVNVLQS